MSEAATQYRAVIHSSAATPASDGEGVNLLRVIGTPTLRMIDPFLMLDEFGSPEPAAHNTGFPDHPHRGFETVTYMLAGAMRHEDSRGNAGVISAGGVQWMTAGRGIVHSEFPEPVDNRVWGFQLWVNLPADQKMRDPRYQEFSADRIPEERRDDGTTVRVIAGRTGGGAQGPVNDISTEPVYLDVTLPPGATFDEAVPAAAHACVYVFVGGGRIGDPEGGDVAAVNAKTAAVLGEGDRVRVEAGAEGARFLLLAGTPINEPVAWHGPFVMNTREEILQAFEDYNAGRLA